MSATELRDQQTQSALGTTTVWLVDRDVRTALFDPDLPTYRSVRNFGGRNLVVTSIVAEEFGPNNSYVRVVYGPPAQQMGGDLEPSELTYKASSGDVTFEMIEVPYFSPLPAETEDGTPYINYVPQTKRVPRRLIVHQIRVNINGFGDSELAVITGQTGKIHTLGSTAGFQFEGASYDRIAVDTYSVLYSWRGCEPYTPTDVDGLIGPTEPLPPHAEYLVIPGEITGTGVNQIEGPPTFFVNNRFDDGDANLLPGNPLGAL